eukprot:COSAG05_NODE_2981_length_2437_cov_1.493584_2_plen_187_part_00
MHILGADHYSLCPRAQELSQDCFQKHPLDFVAGKSALLMHDGSRIPLQPSHVSVGTTPPGSTWSMLPIPPTWLGPRCIPGPQDNAATPNGCNKNDAKYSRSSSPGCSGPAGCPCEPCPQTPGSDCSRCGQGARPQFPPLANYTKTLSNSQKAGEPIVKGGFAVRERAAVLLLRYYHFCPTLMAVLK